MTKKATENYTLRAAVTMIVAAVTFILCIGLGSVTIAPADIISVLAHEIFGQPLPAYIDGSTVSIVWSIRLPRTILAFLVGGALALCGAVIQAILQNPLASSYTLGVSSGAALGAAIITISEVSVPVLGIFLLPLGGFAGGLITVLFVIAIAMRMNRNMQNTTVILLGMVISLFGSAMITLFSVIDYTHEHQLMTWSMGSFAGKRWVHTAVILGAVVICGIYMLLRHRELDIMSFGDDEAMSIGVDTTKEKRRLIIVSSLLTGSAVCFTGVIGFVDLIAPHITRRLFGSANYRVLPMSFLIGGIMMSIADLCARTVLSPVELPVGAVTALVGAPFFLWIFFGGRRR